MSSTKSALRLELTSSRIVACTLSAAHCLASCAVLLSALCLACKLAILGLIAFSWVFYWLRLVYAKSSWFITGLQGAPGGIWLLYKADGSVNEARLLSHYLHPQWMVLWFAPSAWRRRSVILLKDNVGADNLRRYRRLFLDAVDEFK